MAFRIKSRWRNPDDRSLQESAEALAYIIWRLALDRAINLHGEDYTYQNDGQRVAVIAEFLAYQLQVVDRLAYERLSDDDRAMFINALAKRLAEHVQDNLQDLFGPGEYRESFIITLNERMDDYAEFSFDDGKPGYSFLRYFGEKVQAVMGEAELNRWVINQIIEIDGPEVAGKINRSVQDLLG